MQALAWNRKTERLVSSFIFVSGCKNFTVVMNFSDIYNDRAKFKTHPRQGRKSLHTCRLFRLPALHRGALKWVTCTTSYTSQTWSLYRNGCGVNTYGRWSVPVCVPSALPKLAGWSQWVGAGCSCRLRLRRCGGEVDFTSTKMLTQLYNCGIAGINYSFLPGYLSETFSSDLL